MIFRQPHTVCACGALLAFLVFSPDMADAASFTITTGQTATTTQTVDTDGDTGTIDQGGTIATTGATEYGVISTAGTTITNNGTTTTTGSDAFAITNSGANTLITNNGDITTSGYNGEGIITTGASTQIVNNGTIIVNDVNADGIVSQFGSDEATIVNNGSISVNGDSGQGIYVIANNVQATNNGTITTTNVNSAAFIGGGQNGILTNNGQITVSDPSSTGIRATNTGNRLVNNGTITANGSTSQGLEVIAAGGSINNAGTITTVGGTGVAISETLGAQGFINSGTISTTSGTAVTIATNKSATVFNNTGTLSSTTGSALVVDGRLLGTLTNLGTLTSSGFVATMYIDSHQIGSGSLVLNGTIINTNPTQGGVALGFTNTINGTSYDTINTGTIIADGSATVGAGLGTAVDIRDNGIIFENRGTMRGSVFGGLHNQTFIQSAGTFIGNVNLGLDNDVILVTGGTLTGSLNLGDAEDTVVISGGALNGGIDMGYGDNVVQLLGGQSTGNIAYAGGNDNFVLNGGIHTGNVNLDDGGNTMNIVSGTLTGTLNSGANDDRLNLSGGAVIGATDLGGGTNLLYVDGAYTTGGTIGATGGILNTVVATGGALTVNDTLTTGSAIFNIDAGGSLIVNGANVFNNGTLTNNGAITIADTRTLTAATQAAGTANNMTFGINNASNGQLVLTNGGADLTNTTLNAAVVANAGYINNGTVYKIIDGDGSAIVSLPASVNDNSYIYSFTASAGTGGSLNDVLLTVSRAAVNGFADSDNNATIASAFDGLSTSADIRVVAAQSNLSSATTQQGVNDVLESLQPTVDDSVASGIRNIVNQTISLTNTRLTGLRNARSGLSSGDALAHGRVWAQPFAVTVDQDRRDGINGYDLDTYGATVGADTDELVPDMVIGLAATYGRTDANSDNINNTATTIDSYQATVYADHNLGNRAFVDAAVSYGWNEIDQMRHNVGGIAGLTADADYHGQQFIAATDVGQTLTPMHDKGFELTPRAGVRYTHLNRDSYTESDAGGLNLAVDDDTLEALEFGVVGELAYNMSMEHGTWTPSIHAGYKYDVIGDTIQTSSSFTGGGASFQTQGADPQRSTFNAGAGVTFYSHDDLDLSVNYDVQIKDDYVAHAGYVKFVRKF